MIAVLQIECLAKLCVDYSFDGWLINLENTMEPSWVPNATLFLAKLTEQVRKLRAPFTTLVVCYDSVTVEGDLSWQDTVNDRNVCFFNACDGVFTVSILRC
jgi:mannosyl-glycoprotein endo-beta-N-acetylglucosaminidase